MNVGSLLRRALPDWPRRRYTVLTGTNQWREWAAAWRWLVTSSGSDDAVRAFEAVAAQRCGTKHAIAFGAGRMGLYALLEALQFAPGDEIILPGFTCTVVPNALLYRGLRPVYADIDPVTFNLDPRAVERAITPRTRAIHAQHTFGVNCDVAALRAIADRHGLVLLEDAAHSLGARYYGRPHGSLGDAGFFSTDRTKVINTHLGGCATTDDDALAGRLRAIQQRAAQLGVLDSKRIVFSFLAEFLLRAPAIFWLGRPLLGALRRTPLLFQWLDEEWDALPADYPYPCQLTAAQAKLGLSQLAGLDLNLQHRRRLARWLEDRLGWYGSRVPGTFEEQAWLRYSLLVRDRDAFVARFGSRIELGIWFPIVIYGRSGSFEAVGYRAGSCPVAEAVARHIVNFPTHPRIPQRLLESLWSRHGDWLRGQMIRIDTAGEP